MTDPRRHERKETAISRRHRKGCDAKRCDCPYTAAVYDAREGKLIRKQFANLAEARTWREDARGALRRGTMRAPTRRTLAEAAREWLTGAREGTVRSRSGRPYKPSALRGYERALKLRALPELGHLRLSQVSRNDVQDLADRMLAQGFTPSTVLNTVCPLQAIFRRAVKRGEVAVNPTADLDLPRPDGRRDRIASPGEARALLEALPEEQRAVWATAFYAGLRRSELRALRWSDVDLDRNLIRVERAWDAKDGPLEGKSRAARRRVPIARELRAYLAAHKLRARTQDGEALVFGATERTAFEPSTVRRRALKAWADAGLPPIGLHEARHTFASLLIAAGVNAKAISSYMGHSSIQITYDRYGHLMPGNEQEAAGLLDAYLTRESGAVG